ncbi:MAG TPA: type II toxin-antitoxin system prevent-host-death family antitoxin [Chloroflexota bacterium]|nr:type II toxin-antitoxin system prevent-host-death family antitoxin [Chloroflexota bacterium]
MTTKVGVRELRDHVSQILKRVAEQGETIEVCKHGMVVARIVPSQPFDEDAAWKEWNEKADELAEQISAHWQGPQDAVAAVREQRDTYVYRNESATPSSDGG